MAEYLEINEANLADPACIKLAVEGLAASGRRERQGASAFLSKVSQIDPSSLAPYGEEILDALNRKEARTRWECLGVLTNMVSVDSRMCDKAIPEAETSLFDEANGPVRLAAFRFLCRLGSTTENRADKVWPLLDEAVQCYHGDAEFNDMLVALSDFAQGKASKEVRTALIQRMTFDAQNAKGGLKRRAQAVIDSANRKK